MGRVSVSGEEDGVAEAAAENLAQPGWGTLLHELLHDTSSDDDDEYGGKKRRLAG